MAHGGKEWGAIFSENNSGECSRSVMELFNFYFKIHTFKFSGNYP